MRTLAGVFMLVLSITIGAATGATAVASADGPVTCPPGARPDPYTGRCMISVRPPAETPDPPDQSADRRRAPVAGPAPQACVWVGSSESVEVPCEGPDGVFSNARQCYVQLADPQPPSSDPVWEGNSEGAIYRCTVPTDFGVLPVYEFWSASPPAGPAPPDPRLLAQQAITTMDLSAITIGMVPESGPDRLGLVGMPAWMWVEDPAPNTWGPITRSASAGGWTVSATAQVEQVRWDMGDGAIITCGAGDRYEDRFGKSPSPTCGHTYTEQGEFTVSATSHWVITWSGIGQSGTITMDLTRTIPVAIGEVQVLRKH